MMLLPDRVQSGYGFRYLFDSSNMRQARFGSRSGHLSIALRCSSRPGPHSGHLSIALRCSSHPGPHSGRLEPDVSLDRPENIQHIRREGIGSRYAARSGVVARDLSIGSRYAARVSARDLSIASCCAAGPESDSCRGIRTWAASPSSLSPLLP
jgi:hypothetical protein